MNELQKRALSLGLPITASLSEVLRAEVEVANLHTGAQFVPTSLNDENRTIDVVFATETPVRTYSWEDGAVNEVLSMDATNIRWDRINGGAPVLDNHDRSKGTRGQLGTIENARIENGTAVATLRFSKRADVTDTWNDIKDGIIRGISVGYRVHKYDITKEDGKLPTYRAVDWEPFEISMAPVQADPLSQVRNAENKTILTENKNQLRMTELEKRALAAGLTIAATLAEVERAEKENRERNEATIALAATTATENERKRSTEISEAVRSAGLPHSFAATLIKDGKPVDEARKLIIDEIAKTNVEVNGQNRSAASVGIEQREKVREAMANAIEHRANPTIELTPQGREFRGNTMLDLARFSCEQAGINTRGMSAREVAQTSFGLSERAYQTSSDFPITLGNTINRVLRREYAITGATFEPWTNRGSFTDFRPKTVIQLGETTKMEQVAEGAEYTYGTFGEAKEAYGAVKYGKIIPLSWEAIINDDLGAFNRIPRSIAVQAKLLQNQLVYSILSDNAPMNDTVALFHATHKNLAPAGTPISVASLQAARTALRTQTGVDGNTILNLIPKYLVVGPSNELTAYQYTSQNFVPTKNVDINPVYNTQLSVIVDPRITGNEWYLMTDPGQMDTVEYSFLDGEGELFTEQRIGFDIDGMHIKARMVFGTKAIDWRGMYKNAGS